MTVCLAWVSMRRDGRQHLYFASDSRVSGGHRMDACPKVFTLPRSDCALAFAGNTAAAYPLILQVAQAIAAHQPARERSMDVQRLVEHLLRVCTDLIARFTENPDPFGSREVQFLFGGYSWMAKDFRLWRFDYNQGAKEFRALQAAKFHPRLSTAAFIGDAAKSIRTAVFKDLQAGTGPVHLEPLRVLSEALAAVTPKSSIGGPPQVVRVSAHMNSRPLCIRWQGTDTLLGRPLFAYENADYYILDPFTGVVSLPRKFGHREPQTGISES